MASSPRRSERGWCSLARAASPTSRRSLAARVKQVAGAFAPARRARLGAAAIMSGARARRRARAGRGPGPGRGHPRGRGRAGVRPGRALPPGLEDAAAASPTRRASRRDAGKEEWLRAPRARGSGPHRSDLARGAAEPRKRALTSAPEAGCSDPCGGPSARDDVPRRRARPGGRTRRPGVGPRRTGVRGWSVSSASRVQVAKLRRGR